MSGVEGGMELDWVSLLLSVFVRFGSSSFDRIGLYWRVRGTTVAYGFGRRRTQTCGDRWDTSRPKSGRRGRTLLKRALKTDPALNEKDKC